MVDIDSLPTEKLQEVHKSLKIRGRRPQSRSALIGTIKAWIEGNGIPPLLKEEEMKDLADYSDLKDPEPIQKKVVVSLPADMPSEEVVESVKAKRKRKKNTKPEISKPVEMPKEKKYQVGAKVTMVYKGQMMTLNKGKIISDKHYDIELLRSSGVILIRWEF